MTHEAFGDVATLPSRLMGNLDRHEVYGPRLYGGTTDPYLGDDGEAVGMWSRKGHWIRGMARFRFFGDNISAGSGQYRISLPYPVDYSVVAGSGTIGAGTCLGVGRIRDNSTSANNSDVFLQPPAEATQANVVYMVPTNGNVSVSDSSPFTWAELDRITVRFAYPADPTGLPR
jgi:hypothetical protein